MAVVTEKLYLICFAVGTSIISIVFLILGIVGLIEYNLGMGIFTSLITTVVTVIFLGVFLTLREEREWKAVKNAVYSRMEAELSILFSETLVLTENEIDEVGFKYSLLNVKDPKIRKEMIYSKLSELQKKEPLQLSFFGFSAFRSDKEMLATFLEIKKNLGDIQIRYGRHLTSKITEELIKLQDSLEAMKFAYKTDLMINKFKGQFSTLENLMNQLTPSKPLDKDQSSVDLMQTILPPLVKTIVQEIFEFWKLGMEFDLA